MKIPQLLVLLHASASCDSRNTLDFWNQIISDADGDGPTYQPSTDATYIPTDGPTETEKVPSLVDMPTMYPTYTPTNVITKKEATPEVTKNSDVDTETALYASTLNQSKPEASKKSNGTGSAIAAGLLLPLLILVAYGFRVYRKNRADKREAIAVVVQQHDSNALGKPEDVELV